MSAREISLEEALEPYGYTWRSFSDGPVRGDRGFSAYYTEISYRGTIISDGYDKDGIGQVLAHAVQHRHITSKRAAQLKRSVGQ